jgi:acetyl esterase/lipase
MKIKLLLMFSAIAAFSFAQHSTCDGSRYINNDYVPNMTTGIVFGNSTTVGGVNADLELDFFEPTGDLAVNRPLIIFAFGGSFIAGEKEDMHSLCTYFSAKGFACATIDYRLYDGPFFPFPDSTTMTDVVIKAVFDMKAAIRFFRDDADNANTYKIDTNLIFVGGISAGGIVADHAGLLQSTNPVQPYIQTIIDDNGGWTGNSSTNTQYGDGVAGIINYSGALKWASYIDANDPPIFSVHDDQDEVVPYGSGSASVGGIPIIDMQGSGEMHTKAQLEGVNSELITIPNSTGHVSYFETQAGTDSVLFRTLEFLYPLICNSELAIEEQDEVSEYAVYPNPVLNQLQIEVAEFDQFEVRILDNTGRLVLNENISGSNTSIDVANLVPGIYFIELSSQDKTKKFERKQLIKM